MQAPTLPTPTMPTLSNQHQTTSDVERSWAVGDGRVAPAHCRPIDAFHPRLVLAPRHSTASTLLYVTTAASLSFCACVCVYNKQTQHILCWQSRSTLSTSASPSRRNQTHLVNNYLDGISFFPCSPKKMHRAQQQVTVVLRVLSVYANRNCVYLHSQLRRKKKSIWKLNNALPTTSDGLLIETSWPIFSDVILQAIRLSHDNKTCLLT